MSNNGYFGQTDTQQDSMISFQKRKSLFLNMLFFLTVGFFFSVAQAQAAPSVSFSASSEVVYKGEASTLTWQISGATSCTASDSTGWSSSWPTDDGFFSVSPQRDVTYTLNCSDASGQTTSRSVTVAVIPTVTVSVTPQATTSAMEKVVLSWSSNGDQCVDSSSTSVYISGSKEVYPSATTTYTVTCWMTGSNRNNAGSATVVVTSAKACQGTGVVTWGNCSSSFTDVLPSSATKNLDNTKLGYTGSVTLNCSNEILSQSNASCSVLTGGSDPQVTISASASSVKANNPVTLSWQVANAVTCSAYGGGSHVISGTAWSSFSPNINGGAEAFNIAAPTTFGIECWNAAGVSSGRKEVSVGLIASGQYSGFFKVAKYEVSKGEAITLTWDIKLEGQPAGCNMISIDPNWQNGNVEPLGSKTFVPTKNGINEVGNYSYNLCGSSLTPFFSVQVKVIDPPLISYFKAEPSPIDPGQSSKLKFSVAKAGRGCVVYRMPIKDRTHWIREGGDIVWTGVPKDGVEQEASVTPLVSTEYVLECENVIATTLGKTDKKTIVYVNGTIDPSGIAVSICATPKSVRGRPSEAGTGYKVADSSTNVRWKIANAAYCDLTHVAAVVNKPLEGFNNGSLPQHLLKDGSDTFNLGSGLGGYNQPVLFTLRCSDANHKEAKAQVSVGVDGVDPWGLGKDCGSGPGVGGEDPLLTADTFCAQGTCQSQERCQRDGGQVTASCNNGQGVCCLGTSGGTPTVDNLIEVKNPLDFNTVEGLLNKILGFLQGIIAILSLIMIVIGSIVYMTSAGDEKKATTGKTIITAALVGLALAIAAPSFLKEIGTILGWGNNVNGGAVQNAKTLVEILTTALNFLLAIVGVIAIIMLVIGGLMYLLSAGDEDRMKTGKKIVIYSLIGIAIALAALVLVTQVAVLLG